LSHVNPIFLTLSIKNAKFQQVFETLKFIPRACVSLFQLMKSEKIQICKSGSVCELANNLIDDLANQDASPFIVGS